MNRLTKSILHIGGGLAVATIVAATMLNQRLDLLHHCDSGFSRFISCTYQRSSKSIGQGTPIFTTPSSSPPTFRPSYVDVTSWAVAHCPQNYIARRVLCAASVTAPVEAASDDPDTGLPVPKPWVLRTAKNSRFIASVHVETPIDLAAALGFYRGALSKRGWTENGDALVEPDRAVIAFTTSDGPALLRLIYQDHRTIADLSRHKSAAANAGILPRPG